MVMRNNNQPGYILTLTLGLIMLAMFLSTYVFNQGFTFSRFSQTMVDREKARQLALGGIQLAISQLAQTVKKEEPDKGKQAQGERKQPAEGQKEKPLSDAANLLKIILPNLNKAQKFTLKQAVEGINGTLSLVMGSEEGKLNINRLFDFDKHKFVGEGQPNGDMKLMFKVLFGIMNEKIGADLFEPFEKFLKERKYPLNDVTELLKIKEFETFKNTVFFNPTDPAQKQDKLYLTDIFTVASSKKEIEPWLFSHSMLMILKINPQKINFDDLLKNFKEQSDWKNDWNKILLPWYGQDFNALPKTITPLFNSAFAPKMFTVLSSATVNNVTVTLWAFLEREKGSGSDAGPTVRIRKVYLI